MKKPPYYMGEGGLSEPSISTKLCQKSIAVKAPIYQGSITPHVLLPLLMLLSPLQPLLMP